MEINVSFAMSLMNLRRLSKARPDAKRNNNGRTQRYSHRLRFHAFLTQLTAAKFGRYTTSRHPNKDVIASCAARFENTCAPDANMDYFNDYTRVLNVFETFPLLYIWDEAAQNLFDRNYFRSCSVRKDHLLKHRVLDVRHFHFFP